MFSESTVPNNNRNSLYFTMVLPAFILTFILLIVILSGTFIIDVVVAPA
jgi:uncharacterized membrane protein YadS